MIIEVFEELPVCDVCGRAVDRLDEYRDVFRDEVTLSVLCHGERETVTVSSELLVAMAPGKIQFTRAFIKAESKALVSGAPPMLTAGGRR